MGGWDRNAKWNRDVLEHVVTLLFALAYLADFAAGLPYRHRRQVLAVLGNGEAEAWAFVMGLPPDMQAPAYAPETAEDAICLAASFRALAMALCALAARSALFALPGAPADRTDRVRTAAPACRPAPSPAPDTS